MATWTMATLATLANDPEVAAWTSGHRLRDLEAPNALLDVATRRARGGDLIFLATGPDATSLAMAQNTVHMLARLGLQDHAVLLADSLETCERVGERILGADACFWTSRMLGVRPSDSISLRKFWDWRFRFYWAKKHYVAQLLRLGFSVLQADTDTVWVHDPFPALHDICRNTNASLVVQQDNPFVNAGLFYARPGRASQLMLEEMTWRIGLFQNHPEVLPRLVPFATPPFYANSDDQTIFNDVIITMALGTRSFLGGTARMEASNKHNGNHGPEWGTLPESKRHQQQIQGVTRKRGAPWRGLKLPWVSGGLGDFNPRGGARAVHSVPIGFGERIAFAPLALFGHLKTGGAAELLGTAVLHLAAKPGFSMKKRYLESKGLWQSNAPFGNATMPPEDAQAEATRGVARFNATFLELEGRPSGGGGKGGGKGGGSAQGAHKKEERKVERKEGRSRRGKEEGKEEEQLREALRVKLREKRARGKKQGGDDS